MKYLHSNISGYTLIEAVIVAAIGVTVTAWVVPSLRNSHVLKVYGTTEIVQSEQYQKLNPVIEDIREASNQSMQWEKLVPTEPGYDPKTFPWFVKEDPGLVSAQTYVCFYFDDTRKALVRIQTQVAPADTATDPCELNSDRTEKLVTSGLLTPTPTFPMFRGDKDRLAVYITLRIPLNPSTYKGAGSAKSVLEVVRMGSVRS